MSLVLIIALGVVCLLALYFCFNLGEQHFILKLVLLFFFLATLSIIPKATIDEKTSCEYVLNNVTTSAPTDYYVYDYTCNTTGVTTENTFLKTILWFVRLVVTYFLCYLVYDWARRSEVLLGVFKRWQK